MFSSTRRQTTHLIDLRARFEVVALIMAAQQLERLGHMIPGILNLNDEDQTGLGFYLFILKRSIL